MIVKKVKLFCRFGVGRRWAPGDGRMNELGWCVVRFDGDGVGLVGRSRSCVRLALEV